MLLCYNSFLPIMYDVDTWGNTSPHTASPDFKLGLQQPVELNHWVLVCMRNNREQWITNSSCLADTDIKSAVLLTLKCHTFLLIFVYHVEQTCSSYSFSCEPFGYRHSYVNTVRAYVCECLLCVYGCGSARNSPLKFLIHSILLFPMSHLSLKTM